MDDVQWLATRVGVSFLGGQPFVVPAGAIGDGAGYVVEPTRVAAAKRALEGVDEGVRAAVIAVIGYPDGRHRSLVKSAEARLAVEEGADEVWLVADPDGDASATLADVIAVRQGVQVPFGVFYTGRHSAAAAQQVGAEKLICRADQLPELRARQESGPDIAVLGAAPGVEAAIGHLEAGAAWVYAAGNGQVTGPAAAGSAASGPAPQS